MAVGENDIDRGADRVPPDTHVISRTWVTSFRKYIEKKVNELKNTPSKNATDESKPTPCGGIDNLDLSELDLGEANKKNIDGGDKKSTESTDPFKGEDPTSKISCEQDHRLSFYAFLFFHIAFVVNGVI